MKVTLISAPSEEPITLDEFKLHLRIDSGSFEDNVDSTQSLSPGSYAIAADYTTHIGTAVNVLGYGALVLLEAGTNGVGGTVDVKIQECDTQAGTYTDWADGAFTQVTEANDNTTYEKTYTGTKAYIRVVAKVLVAACEFGVSVLRRTATVIEDDLLNEQISTARQLAEDMTSRKFITQTWDYYLQKFPREKFFKLPFGNLQTVTYIKYTDSDGDVTTMTENTDYIVETNDDACGRIVLPYATTWPSFTEYPSNPIVIRFVCGWLDAASVPEKIKSIIKLIGTGLYENRESMMWGIAGSNYQDNKMLQRMVDNHVLWDVFE